MRRERRALIFVVLVGLVLTLAGECYAEGLRYTIGVTKFENRSGWRGQWDIGDAWGAVLTDSLYQTGRFIVVGEKDMRQDAMMEQDLAASGRYAQ